MANSQTEAIVAGCLVEKDGKYLLVQERQPKAYSQCNLPTSLEMIELTKNGADEA
jgi:hypothetical protein